MDFLHLCAIYFQIFTTLLIVFSRNPIHSILLLILLFFEMTFVLILFNIEFISLLLIVVYVGAIAVLFLFVVMMLQVKSEPFNSSYIILISFILSLFFYFENVFLLSKHNNFFSSLHSSSRLVKVNSTEKKFAFVSKRTFCSLNPKVRLTDSTISLFQNSFFQSSLLFVPVLGHYLSVFGFVPNYGILTQHFVFIMFVLFFFLRRNKEVKKATEKRKLVGFFIFGVYFLFSLILSLLFSAWFRVFFSLLALSYLLIKICDTYGIKILFMPEYLKTYLRGNMKDRETLEYHFWKTIPLVGSIRNGLFIHTMFCYLYFVFRPFSDGLEFMPDNIVYTVNFISICLVFVLVYTWYIVLCCNTPPENTLTILSLTLLSAGFGWLACQFQLNASSSTTHLSHLPKGFKYIHQNAIGAVISVDEYDRESELIRADMVKSGFFGLPEPKDPLYPDRRDAKAWMDAYVVFKKGGSRDDVIVILDRNIEAAQLRVNQDKNLSLLDKVIRGVPQREDMRCTKEISDMAAERRKPFKISPVVLKTGLSSAFYDNPAELSREKHNAIYEAIISKKK